MILIDIIKIKYIQSGYLPDWPYHLISDEEMLNAFIVNDDNFFNDNYKIESTDEVILEAFQMLRQEILYYVDLAKQTGDIKVVPNWVFSYMLGAVVSSSSSLKDIDDLIALSNLTESVPAGQFSDELYRSNMKISSDWISKLPTTQREHRPVTIFGEPHVIKSLRLAQVDVLK